MWWGQRGRKRHHNMAAARCMLDYYGCMRISTRPRSARTHTQCIYICNTAFSRQEWFHDRTSVSRYTHFVLLITWVAEMRWDDSYVRAVVRGNCLFCFARCSVITWWTVSDVSELWRWSLRFATNLKCRKCFSQPSTFFTIGCPEMRFLSVAPFRETCILLLKIPS
jgi:hypothetical protein